MKSITRAHRIAVLCTALFCLLTSVGTAQDQIPEPQPLHWGPPSIDEALSGTGNRAENLRSDDPRERPIDKETPTKERSVLREVQSNDDRLNDVREYARRDARRNVQRTAERRGASRHRSTQHRTPAWSPDRTGVRRPPWQGTLLPNPERGPGNPPFVVVDRTGTKRRYIRRSANVDLSRHLHQTAIVHEDTGLILSASQLDFPSVGRSELTDDGTELASHDRGHAIGRHSRVKQAAYENDYEGNYAYENNYEYGDYRENDKYGYEFEDAYDDSHRGSYDYQRAGDRSVYNAQHFEELPPGASTGLPFVETGPGNGGKYVLEGEGPAVYGDSCGCTSCRAKRGLLGLRLGVGSLFGGSNRCSGGCSDASCIGGNGCDGCAAGPCGPICETKCGSCTDLPAFWVNADYFVWWTDGMYLPPLVTTSPAGTDLAEAGRLGFPDTRILYGGRDVLTDRRDGGRLRGGFRIAPRFGIQADYFGLEEETNRYRESGTDGTPIVTRPFFDIMRPADVGGNVIPAEGRERVSFPAFGGSPAISGTITVDTVTDLESFGITGRYGLCCEEIDCGDCLQGGVSRIHVLGGYRYMQLDEGLHIREDLNTTSDTPLPVTFVVRDSFRTHNDFHGGEIGTNWEWEEDRWSLELLTKLAVGSTRQLVVINGSTVIGGDVTNPGTFTGGLLAQTSNIGTHKRHVFSMIPELGATVAYRVTDRFRLTGGYTLIYWSRVVRPGKHVDLDVNRNLIPDGGPAVADPGPLRPAFAWSDTDFWAQGVNAGVDYRW